jgi:hypothetical protein
LHLDDQMDAKALLGAYTVTPVPGEFAWQPGPLTQAVAAGRWVLVENVNMAPGAGLWGRVEAPCARVEGWTALIGRRGLGVSSNCTGISK